MRRLILEEPVTKAAIWSRRLALFSIALCLIAVLLVRTRATDVTAGMSVFGFAILSACLAVLLAGAAAAVIWRTGRRGMGLAVSGVLLGLLVLGFPAWLAVKSVTLPMLNDISTDIKDPPSFARSSRALAARNGHVPAELGAEARAEQPRAYPGVQPIIVDVDVADTYQMVLRAAAALGWEIADQVAPGGRRGDGRIDAVDRTPVMRFPDDIVVRVRPLAGQTRIDVRSVSRYGRHDFGVNARRIEKFAQEMQAQLDAR
ncbi:MAG: hypothetical protein JWN93_1039 [Hyphomicrobiales bacterium]|nr:hypothetical protein [Hyphomicrobiales bacterium]